MLHEQAELTGTVHQGVIVVDQCRGEMKMFATKTGRRGGGSPAPRFAFS